MTDRRRIPSAALILGAAGLIPFLWSAALAASGRKAILDSPRMMTWMKRAFAASFAALGARLAMERAA